MFCAVSGFPSVAFLNRLGLTPITVTLLGVAGNAMQRRGKRASLGAVSWRCLANRRAGWTMARPREASDWGRLSTRKQSVPNRWFGAPFFL
jgi:hypothetical protein